MEREVSCAALALTLALNLALVATNATAAADDASVAGPDPALHQGHVEYREFAPADIAPREACGKGQNPAELYRMPGNAWVDPARQVHGSGLIDNCKVTPEPDERGHADASSRRPAKT